MAPVTFFHCIPRDTLLHRMDARLKLLCLVLLSVAVSFAVAPAHYLAALCAVMAALFTAELPLPALLKDMKIFGVIIAIVLVVDAFSIPGPPIPNFPVPGVSLPGVVTGLRFAGRLTIIIMACAVMTGTTSLLTFKNVVEWYLRPVPFIPEARVAMMINLTFVFIPLIFDQYVEMMSAQKARCADLRKNPIRRISFIVLPLLSRTLRRTDEIVYAMEARCYSETRTRPRFKTHPADWLILAAAAAALVFILYYPCA
ncbi:MAG: energy-coupling factor transporter transmembrane protein EcfT [Gracilibacteraceae bacterium]|jgi:energy-coupling factor transporter transmembrane protein EcfT|nr:energy-coupling factor transporter transmembrane protein EcfT [Gracilibacteraceae bacterium]